MKHALVIGKFYPPHIGHHKLINTALDECDHVTVAVCYSSVENIPVEDRIEWLKAEHPSVTFMKVKDDTPVLYTDETWGWFLDALMESLRRRMYANNVWGLLYPNVLYSGEDYIDDFARRLQKRYGEHGISFNPISTRKLDRSELICRATDFRNDPDAHWGTLAPATRAGLCKRVVICGAESSGTTTLAKALANHYKTTVVPEYGRHFDWAVGKHHVWKTEDFVHIARAQRRWEEDLARESENGLLICDTDQYATAMFHEVYLGSTKMDLTDFRKKPADLYIITDDADVAFEDDGTRLNSGRRPWMTRWFETFLPSENRIVVWGDHEQRMTQAIVTINEYVLRWDIETPIEYRELAT